MWVHSATCTWHDKNRQLNAWYRDVLTTQLNHLASLAKWLTVCSLTKWLWVRILLQSLKFRISRLPSSKEFLHIQATIECGFTLKRVRDMIRTYSQMHPTHKYSKRSSIISPVWLNGLVFVYELSACGFESRCSHLNFRFRPSFEQGFPWHSGNYRVWIHSEMRIRHDKNIQSNAPHR